MAQSRKLKGFALGRSTHLLRGAILFVVCVRRIGAVIEGPPALVVAQVVVVSSLFAHSRFCSLVMIVFDGVIGLSGMWPEYLVVEGISGLGWGLCMVVEEVLIGELEYIERSTLSVPAFDASISGHGR